MIGLKVIQPGIFSLPQDSGRFGQHAVGLTTGGPLDSNAFRWANRLCGNGVEATAIEVTIGGLVLESTTTTQIALTGADIPLTINKQPAALWQSHTLNPGDRIELGFSTAGSRGYLAVAGGFHIDPIFNSASTVPPRSSGWTDSRWHAIANRTATALRNSKRFSGLSGSAQTSSPRLWQ